MVSLMHLRALLLIFIFVCTSGVLCAIVCPEDTLDSHSTKCTQCISTDLLVSAKSSDHQQVDAYAFGCAVSMDVPKLFLLTGAVDHPQSLTDPPFHPTAVLPLRV
jgi:hypothetical protein